MIRAAADGDTPEIATLWNWMIRETLATFTTEEKTDHDIRQMIKARAGLFFVAEKAGSLVGFATCGPFRAGPGYAFTVEHSVIVSPTAHGTGCGRALMTSLETKARDHGVHVMVAAISSANPTAIAFHKAIGYDEAGRLAEVGRKAGEWLDLVLMQKILDPVG